jgi:flavin-dependent dehydrogenase
MWDMTISQHYTSIVCGCGPAGIMAARYAAVQGPVLLIDTVRLPRNKSCGGMLNEYAQDFIAKQLPEKIPDSILSAPDKIRFRFFDWDRDIRKPTNLTFVNVDRQGFDEWLMRFLPDNVEVKDNTRLIYATQDCEGVTVQLRAADDVNAPVTTFTCDYLVGADGPMGTVRSLLPVSQPQHYKTIQEYLPLVDRLEPYFDCLYARGVGKDYGYGYLIPKGDQCILGSVFFPHTKNAGKLHEKAKMLFSSYYPIETEPTRREAWSAVQVAHEGDIASGFGRILLAGEAGGIFSPTSGEGISFALNSGSLAGTAIALAQDKWTQIGPRDHMSFEESDALKLYRIALDPIVRTISRRLRLFPIINSNWGKYLGGNMPDFVVDYTAHNI